MKIEECKKLLDQTIEILETKLNHDDYSNLFSNINQVHKFENDHIFVIVPDALTKYKIEKFHLNKMNEILSTLTESNYRYKFIVEEDAKKELESKENLISSVDTISINKSKRKLRSEFTFDNYVIGESNRFAFISAMKVAESPHSIFNPLYIFGDVGLGKTHLMMAIGHFILDNNVSANVVYSSAQQFTEDYFLSTSTKRGKDNIEEFYNRYRSADVLLVDDIQFLDGKLGTQEEFFKVFDYLHENNKQIVITSDRVANDLKLMARLKSRFNWGMIADIKHPDKDTRVNILKRKLTFLINNPKDVPIEVLELIADMFPNNIRDLEGAIRRYITYCVSLDIPFTLQNVYVALSGILPNTVNMPIVNKTKDIDKIKEVVCSYFRVSIEDIVSPSRKNQIVYARNIAIYIIRKKYNTPLKKIGEYFGKRDHATIAHAYDKIKQSVLNDQHIKNDIDFILKKLDE